MDKLARETAPSDKETAAGPCPSVTDWLPEAAVESVAVPTTTFGDTGLSTCHAMVALPVDAFSAMVPPSVPVRLPVAAIGTGG